MIPALIRPLHSSQRYRCVVIFFKDWRRTKGRRQHRHLLVRVKVYDDVVCLLLPLQPRALGDEVQRIPGR